MFQTELSSSHYNFSANVLLLVIGTSDALQLVARFAPAIPLRTRDTVAFASEFAVNIGAAIATPNLNVSAYNRVGVLSCNLNVSGVLSANVLLLVIGTSDALQLVARLAPAIRMRVRNTVAFASEFAVNIVATIATPNRHVSAYNRVGVLSANVLLLVIGTSDALQLVAMFAPAIRMRVRDTVAFASEFAIRCVAAIATPNGHVSAYNRVGGNVSAYNRVGVLSANVLLLVLVTSDALQFVAMFAPAIPLRARDTVAFTSEFAINIGAAIAAGVGNASNNSQCKKAGHHGCKLISRKEKSIESY